MSLIGFRMLANILANIDRQPTCRPGGGRIASITHMKLVTVHTAKTTLSQLIAAAEAGEDVIIQRGHEAVVRLVPVAGAAKRQFGALAGKVSLNAAYFESLPADELSAWES